MREPQELIREREQRGTEGATHKKESEEREMVQLGKRGDKVQAVKCEW